MRNKKGQFVKGNYVKTEFKKGDKGYWLGKKRPEMGEIFKKANKGRKASKETKKRMSIAHSGERHWNWKGDKGFQKGNELRKGLKPDNGFPKGHLSWNKGLPPENQPAWLGGKSFEPYSIDWTETLKRSIRERDHYLCQLCSQYGNVIHHIDYNKKNCDPENLITLCAICNGKVNFNRNYWLNYFIKL